MQNPIVTDPRGVTLLGGGKASPATLKEALRVAPKLVAADGAAAFALKNDVIPNAVIGDFDSLDNKTRELMLSEHLHHIPEQNSTDFEKCLTRVSAPLIIGVGFTGRRADHEMAVYNVMVRYPEKRVVLLSKHDVCFVAPTTLTLNVGTGTRVSLFPMREVTGRSEGLKWPIEGITFAPDGRIGTSNEATQETVTLEMDGTGMLVFLPRGSFPAVLDALARVVV